MPQKLPELNPQALRLRRFFIATATYVLGFVLLGLCALIGLFPVHGLMVVGSAFAVVNLVFFFALRSGWNQRFKDPSLTMAQVCIAATTVMLILVMGEQIHLLAVPFYSSLFVFAMLHMSRRDLVRAEVFVLVTYGVALALRMHRFGATLDLRVEAVHAALVVLSSIWYALAAGYIGGLRSRLRTSVRTIEELAQPRCADRHLESPPIRHRAASRACAP